MKPIFHDTHAHLDFPDFEKDLAEVVQRAEEAGITRIITIGTTLETSCKAIALAERLANVFAAVGWHPSYVTSAPEAFPPEFRELAAHPKVVAIGECGLDYAHLPSRSGETAAADELYKTRQARLFKEQLELAAENELNVIVHQREAFADAMEILTPFASKLRAVFHCFVGAPEEMQKVVALGSLVSFTGIATFKNAATVRETIRAVPSGSFMLETDCPFLAPVPYRGKRCEPAYVREIAACVAKERNCSLEELSEVTCRNSGNFFARTT
jgi:TatD DNase family protein